MRLFLLSLIIICCQCKLIGQQLHNPFFKDNGLKRYSLDNQSFQLTHIAGSSSQQFTGQRSHPTINPTLSIALPTIKSISPKQEFGNYLMKLGIDFITKGKLNAPQSFTSYKYTPPLSDD